MEFNYGKINLKGVSNRYLVGARALLKELGLEEGEDVSLVYSPEESGVCFDGERLFVGGSLGRGLRLFKESGGKAFSSEEEPAFTELGFLFDCAKNKIPTTETFRDMLVKLALMGYNKAYIAVESEMTLEGEPYFGYGSFRFKGEELKEWDDFAYSLGIELIPAVATFTGFVRSVHRFFYWPAYWDGDEILCGSQENVLALIGKFFDFWRKNLRSDKLHIGMDDTGGIMGRWWYYKRNGFKEKDKIVVDHVRDVLKIAREKGYKDIEMYSDLLFTVSQPDAEKYTNYDKDFTEEREYNLSWCDTFHLFGATRKRYPETQLTEYIQEKLDKDVRLCSTFVTGEKSADWEKNFARHRALENPLAYALPVKCGNFTSHNGYYLKKLEKSVNACKKAGVKSYTVMFLNDRGGECSIYAHMPVLARAAEKCYGDTSELVKSVTGVGKDKFLLLDLPDELPHEGDRLVSPSEYGLYGDVFLGIFDQHIRVRDEGRYPTYAAKLLTAARGAKKYAYLFKTRAKLCEILSKKYALGIRLRNYYREGNKKAVKKLVQENFEPLIEQVKKFAVLVKKEWMNENLLYSFEVQELHLGGLLARLRQQKKRLEKYLLKGEAIPELEETIINETNYDYPDQEPLWESDWCRIVSVNRI